MALAKLSVALPKIATEPTPGFEGPVEAALVGHEDGPVGASAVVAEGGEQLGRVGELGHPGRVDEGGRLDRPEAGGREAADELGLDLGRHDGLLVLEAVPGADLVDRHPLRQVGRGLDLGCPHAHAAIVARPTLHPMSQQDPNPFAAPGGGPAGSGPSYGAPGQYASQGPAPAVGSYNAAPPPANVSAIVLLVLSTIAVIPTFLLATPPFVMSIVALARNRDAPRSSRRLALLGWALLAVAVVIAGAVWWWILDRLASGGGDLGDPFST